MSSAGDRISSGEAWAWFCDELCARLKAAGYEILRETDSPLDRTEGLRLLTRDLRYSIERAIEQRDPDFPSLMQVTRETMKFFADCPDYFLQSARISGANRYRMQGTIGEADHVSFETQGTDPSGGGRVITGSLASTDLDLDANGGFEIAISCERADGNWLPMAPHTSQLTVRNIFHSDYRIHQRHHPAKLMIERIGEPGAPGPYRPEALADGLAEVVRFAGTAQSRAHITRRLRSLGVGRFSDDQADWSRMGANPNTFYQQAYWALAPDEAMVIDVGPRLPGCTYWCFELTNQWMESLDYRFHPVYRNNHTATVRTDGSLRFIVAHRDPGVRNWLDTAGHSHGCMVWRWNNVERIPPLPKARLVSFEGLTSLES